MSYILRNSRDGNLVIKERGYKKAVSLNKNIITDRFSDPSFIRLTYEVVTKSHI